MKMELQPSDIIEFVRKSITRPMRIRELAKAMGVVEDDYRVFRKVITGMMKSGALISLKRGRIGLPEQVDLVVGPISITSSGTGFVGVESAESEEEIQDILIPPQHLSTALDGDRVAIRREGFSRGRQLGAVVTILERSRSSMVGVFHRSPHYCFVAPDDRRLHRDIYIPEEETNSAQEGDKVAVKLFEWTDPYRNPEGKVTDILGKPGDPKVELAGIIQSFKLPEKFPARVSKEAKKVSLKFDEAEIKRREDWREKIIYTIDPASAKDHDDAISVEKTENGYRLGVHIADVSFFVEEGSALDAEAYGRGNSVYLPNRVIPMLPESLSNGLCSLTENDDRLAHSCIIEYDEAGKALEWRIADTVIRSRAKLSYEDAQSVFDGSPANEKAKKLAEPLLLARELAKKVAAKRFAAGTLDFDLSEAQIVFDEKTGGIASLGVKRRLEAHRLVEEFMLAANKAVALQFMRAALPTIYRVHDKPDPEKLKAFADLAKACGHKFPLGGVITPLVFQGFLDSLKGAPEQEYLNELALRSMKKAVYQPLNLGHFGLGFAHYTHFTSPIRRYADLVIHRLLRKAQKGKYLAGFAKSLKDKLGAVGKHISETERAATVAEREAIKVMQVIFLKEHVGAEYSGVITGVVARGIFVRLIDVHAEGMVRVSSIDDDFYHFDSERHRMVGSRSRRVFRLGDRVRVVLVSVDPQRREIDLALVSETDRPERGKRTSGKVGSFGRRPSGKTDSGKKDSGKKASEKRVSGKKKKVPGKQVSGKKVSGKKASRKRSRK